LIFYDEFGQLLGADTESIKLFGCNNISEFKEKVSDISDFFVNKDGYIHKFDHYSWIDFLNYSEENIDKVLIKQKENNIIEAKVTVKEIYNLIKINDSETTYMIDFIKKKILPLENEPLKKVEENDIKQNDKENVQEDKINNENKTIEQDILKDKIELDYNKMENEYDIDKELYQELLNDFISESKIDLDLMSAYVVNNNYESLLKIISKLKSICTNLNLKVFLPMLSSMERNIRNKNYDGIERLLDIYKKELRILIKNIR